MIPKKNTVIRLKHVPPPGLLKRGVFEFVEEPMPIISDGEILLQYELISLDAGSRGQLDDQSNYPLRTMPGDIPLVSDAIAKVILSRHSEYKAGDIVYAATVKLMRYAAVDVERYNSLRKLSRDNVPLDVNLGVLGRVGFTAYCGMLFIAQPNEGETVLVSAAAGATGSVASQIAKLKGCRVVGIAGGPQKCEYVVREFGLDACIDYKAGNLAGAIKESCPNGIDIYYENVGGEIQKIAYEQMNNRGRIVMCGMIDQYSGGGRQPGPNLMDVVNKHLRIEGFISTDYLDRYSAFLNDMQGWYAEGRVKHASTITDGFENWHEAVNSLMSGKNIGKQICKL